MPEQGTRPVNKYLPPRDRDDRRPRAAARPAARGGGRLPRLARPDARPPLSMHPAPSIIVFTTLSGLGFGLMAWLGIGAHQPAGWAPPPSAPSPLAPRRRRPARQPPPPRPAAPLPQGLLPVAHAPGSAARRCSPSPRSPPSRSSPRSGCSSACAPAPLGWPAAALALATVFATAMIYAQMRSVPRWRSPLTPALFLLAALAGGALLAGAAGAGALAPRGPRPRPARRLGARATGASPRAGTHARHRHRPRRPRPAAAARAAAHRAELPPARDGARRRPRARAQAARWPASPSPCALPLGARAARAPGPCAVAVAALAACRRRRWSCAGSSSRRPNTWLDSTTEGGKTADPVDPGGCRRRMAKKPDKPPKRSSTAARAAPASRRGCRWRRSAGGARPRACASCSSPAATPAAG